MRAFEDPRCLACHGEPEDPGALRSLGPIECSTPEAIALIIGPSGVGCEECHGPARAWRDLHYRPGWPGEFPDAAATMTNLSSSRSKAEACLRCHAGDGLGREVNHDLIAAGHPRLAFELSRDADRMPTHWDRAVAEEKRRRDGLPVETRAETWAVGQMVALRTALELLAERAAGEAGREREAPWPEFAEYSCTACHHDLMDGGLRESRGAAVPGSFSWGTWTLPMARPIVRGVRPELLGPIESLEGLMRRPFPDAARVGAEASRLADGLGTLLDEFEARAFSSDDLRRILARVAVTPAEFEGAVVDRDASMQLYLAARALVRDEAEGLGGIKSASREGLARVARQLESLERIRGLLDAPKPRVPEAGGAGDHEAIGADSGEFGRALRELLDSVSAGAGP